ncbi:GroES-like protein [Diplogelasinospora grovesii]|uniref:GroES-like protein n=1 Tax=Diplogelasinospora grovesii TaxID=303347 RepID=A0AAN6NB28_9PEZI|nr:GroES-like protein [Diplogelasinospora grovesii]
MAPTIPNEMKAVQVVEYGRPYSINTVPVPSNLGPHDLLIKIACASHCHTDSMVRSGVFGTKLPCTGSHEGAGTVVSVGSAVSSFNVGDRVMCGLPLHPCGTCPDCTSSDESTRQYCPNLDGHVGVHLDGNFAEYVRVDSRSSTPVPDAISLISAAPLACAGRTVWRAVSQADLKNGQWLAIVGSGGGLGHLGIQFAKARGLNVIGIDARDEGLALSEEAGADIVIDARKDKAEVVKEVQQVTGGGGADASITLADADSAAGLACAVTKMHGTMVQIAQPDEVKIPFAEFIFRDVRVKGSVLCSPGESRDMMNFIVEQGINVKTNLFHGLDKIEELIEMVEGGKIQGKAVIIVDEKQIQNEKELGVKY